MLAHPPKTKHNKRVGINLPSLVNIASAAVKGHAGCFIGNLAMRLNASVYLATCSYINSTFLDGFVALR